MSETRIPYTKLEQTFEQILIKSGFSAERAQACAALFAQASLDGVASHGLNRFPTFMKMIREGYIKPDVVPVLEGDYGVLERWHGMAGPGPLNAQHCMDRAIAMAKEKGIGCVALSHTNHWMRAGNYGWQAVDAGCIGICFTNTIPNMPAWGGSEPVLGNNPLVIAIPRENGPIVLDMAMSQFSYGKMSAYLRNKAQLPYEGGFDQSGKLSKDPATILEKEMALPIGLWKGAGLSLLLDILAAVLSNGNATHHLGATKVDHAMSQVFLCFYLPKLGISEYPEAQLDAIIDNLKSAAVFGDNEVRYPGENILKIRAENLQKGVPVDEKIWEKVLEFLVN